MIERVSTKPNVRVIEGGRIRVHETEAPDSIVEIYSSFNLYTIHFFIIRSVLLHIVLHGSRNAIYTFRLGHAQPPVEINLVHDDVFAIIMCAILVFIAFFLRIASQLHGKGLSGVFAELQILNRKTTDGSHNLNLGHEPQDGAVRTLVEHIEKELCDIVNVIQF